MRFRFDGGTVLLEATEADAVSRTLPGLLWDARVGAFRAPASAWSRIRDAIGPTPTEGMRTPTQVVEGWSHIDLRQYQEAALTAWELAGRRGIVVLPTGAGKTMVALAAMARSGPSALCLVPTRVLLDQWKGAIEAAWSGPVGRLGDGTRQIERVTVSTFESAYRTMHALGNRFDLLIVDEVHPQRAGLVSILSAGPPGVIRLRMSGPLRLFRRTTRYGHALGALLQALGRCPRFDLVAALAVGERELELRLRTGDPFLPARARARGRRAVHLARLLASDDWLAEADPEPIGVGARLLFPDVELISRAGRSSWLIECVGFWTPEYLEEKRAVYAAAGVTHLILSVDARLQCGEGEVPAAVPVALHRGRVDVEDLWRIIEG